MDILWLFAQYSTSSLDIPAYIRFYIQYLEKKKNIRIMCTIFTKKLLIN